MDFLRGQSAYVRTDLLAWYRVAKGADWGSLFDARKVRVEFLPRFDEFRKCLCQYLPVFDRTDFGYGHLFYQSSLSNSL
jgi:hypothetical protein